MINFKEFLEEGVNDYFLYHGTRSAGLTYIIQDNTLKAMTYHNTKLYHSHVGTFKHKHAKVSAGGLGYDKSTYQDIHGPVNSNMRYHGVSLSRSFKFSTEWGKTQNGEGAYYADYAVFKLNRRKLQQHYKLLPVNFYGDPENRSSHIGPHKARYEFEEFVLGDIKGLARYCEEIWCSNERTRDIIDKNVTEEWVNIPVRIFK